MTKSPLNWTRRMVPVASVLILILSVSSLAVPTSSELTHCQKVLQTLDHERPKKFTDALEASLANEGPMTITYADGSKEEVPRPEEFSNARAWDRAVLGIFADIEKPPSNDLRKPGPSELIPERVESLRLGLLGKPEFRRALQKKNVTLPKQLAHDISIFKMTEDFVIIELPYGQKPGGTQSKLLSKDPVAAAFRSGLQVMNLQLYNRAYRRSQLVPNEGQASAKLMDAWVDSVYELEWPTTYLGFQKSVWEQYVNLLNETISEINSLPPESREAKELLHTLSQPLKPFYASFGLTVFDNLNKNNETSFRRLFKNDRPDPLNFLAVKGPEHNDLLKFYRLLITRLEDKTEIEVHAHTNAHVVMYRALGFSVTGVHSEPEWDAQSVTTMRVTKEVILAKLAEIIH